MGKIKELDLASPSWMGVLQLKEDFRNKDLGTEVKNLMATSLQQGIGPADLEVPASSREL